MGIFSLVIESEDIIRTGFDISSENIGPATINIYILFQVMLYYE
jgi:hypothetical protein